MNLLDTILNAQDGATAKEAGHAVGLSSDETASALQALIPALAAGLHRNTAQPGGLESLLGALQSGSHERYLEQPSTVAQPEAVNDGNHILGHILGSKDASRAVANQASARTGIGADVLKKLLPMAATMVMSSLAKKRQAGSGQSGGNDLLGMLTPMLDRDGDGSVIDDLLGGAAGKLFGGR